uniref:TRAF-type domain-containing protein n=1 Tax=Chromera velia CCMP2878 TaxID=1169474 RepID=A0A0K6SA07_9ALVE|eukprot:Cvel_33093.t2-p1 / transcript=Cvel_33093.t2 / gene=Cvel_33093 / organism=Chromera_velia_CCMP2878 / gene_product=TNF receptor-associated factor family protein, putative / transcript_product=TNF receptor-associated factor family protein, putative / location=Cvel_scaffold5286:1668-2848(-) / protein_length=280 / sequence_SO=supercontig / SO=protein_coding / is_pseudo=false
MEEAECRYSGCDVKMPRGKIASHEKKCPLRTVPCERCDLPISHNGKRLHNSVCPRMPVKCPHKCGTDLLRSEVPEHLARECPEETVKSLIPGCKTEMKRQLLGAHLTEKEAEHRELIEKCERRGARAVTVKFRDFEKRAASIEKGWALESDFFHFQLFPKGGVTAREGMASLYLVREGTPLDTFRCSVQVVSGQQCTLSHPGEGKEDESAAFSVKGCKYGWPNFCSFEPLLSAARSTEEGNLQFHLKVFRIESPEPLIVDGYGPARLPGRGGGGGGPYSR